MTWFLGVICFVIGLVAGAILFKQFKSDEARVKTLEEQLENLEREHETYKDNVHAHFNNTAQLLNNLTDSYRDVYRHMASGAQTLCPDYISDQLSHSAKEQESLTRDTFADSTGADGVRDVNGENGGNGQNGQNGQNEEEKQELVPPRDYADKISPDQKGTLDEDYGLDKGKD